MYENSLARPYPVNYQAVLLVRRKGYQWFRIHDASQLLDSFGSQAFCPYRQVIELIDDSSINNALV